MNKPILRLVIVLLIFPIGLVGQDDYPYPALSPKGKIIQEIGNTKIEIEYERPSVRGRKVFGQLVPWNKVWRTGAGYCTKISFDKPVRIAGSNIQAGKYSLFTIPNPDEWVIIVNSDTSLYGSYNYDHNKDVARFVAVPKTSGRFFETMTIDLDIIPNNARLFISWENTQVDFEILTSTDEQVLHFIRHELGTIDAHNSDTYAGAADYFLYQNRNLLEAVNLANEAIKRDGSNGFARRVKIEILERLRLFDEASEEINQAIEMVKHKEYEKEEYRKQAINSFEKYRQKIESMQKNPE